MENFIVVLILLLIVSLIVIYLIRARSRGEKCIGCPYCKQCGGKCGGKIKKAPERSENSEKASE